MTDLKNMSVDELCARGEDCQSRIGKMCSEGRPPSMSIPVRPEHDDDVFISATLIEMARRLRETEKESEARRVQLGVCSIERTAEWKRAEQAASALLACQVREAELRDVLKDADGYLSDSPLNQIGSGSQLHREMQVVLSRSTGSKIMAVVEAAKEWADSDSLIATASARRLYEAVRALEAKRD